MLPVCKALSCECALFLAFISPLSWAKALAAPRLCHLLPWSDRCPPLGFHTYTFFIDKAFSPTFCLLRQP